MPEKLPKGWAKAALGEIAKPSRERAMPSEFPDMQYVGLEHIEPQTMRLIGHRYARENRSSSIRFSEGDILYGKMRPYLNKVWVAEFDGLCSAEFLVFPKREGLNSHYLAMRLNAEDFVAFANGQVSGERPRVDFEKLSDFSILLPPVAEQNRIVTKLRATIPNLVRAGIAFGRAKEELQNYRGAVMHAAVTGELTRDWRENQREKHQATIESGDALLSHLIATRRSLWEGRELQRLGAIGKEQKNDKWKSRYDEPGPPDITDLSVIPPNWAWARLQQIGFIIGGLTKNPSRIGLQSKLPYLRVANVYANELRLDNVASIGVDESELEKLLLEKGDLLIVEGNGSRDQIGRLAIWDGSIERCVHQNHIIKVRLVENELGKWILSWLLSPLGRQHIEKIASSTTGLYTLSITKVGDLPIPLPPAAEQSEINREIKRRLGAADRLAATLHRQIEQAHSSRKAIFCEAFTGRLLPQDAHDEPASFLLERLREVQKVEANKPRGKQMPKRKSKLKPIRRRLLDVLREHNGPMTPEQLFINSGFQLEFEGNECRQEIVDIFYEELRQIVSLEGPVIEKRPNSNTVLLEVKR